MLPYNDHIHPHNNHMHPHNDHMHPHNDHMHPHNDHMLHTPSSDPHFHQSQLPAVGISIVGESK